MRPTSRAAADDAEWRQQVEAQMQQLERENAELRERVGVVAETQLAINSREDSPTNSGR